MIALTVGNVPLGAAQIATLSGSGLNVHGRCDQLTLRTFAAVLQGQQVDDNELTELIALNRQLETRSGQEPATISIALALHQRGHFDEARQLVSRYLHVTRRESWKPRNPILLSFETGEPLVDPERIRAVVATPLSAKLPREMANHHVT